jgi:hypothetical protein
MSSVSSISSSSVTSSVSSTSATSFAQAFQDLGSALQSGNVSAAQTAFQDLMKSGKGGHHHGHHAGGAGSSSSTGGGTSISSVFQALGSALQSGNLQGAQSAFATLQQDFSGAQGSSQSGTNSIPVAPAASSQELPAGSTFSIQI